MDIIFGALAPKLGDQLKGIDVAKTEVIHWQKDADAITRLAIRLLLSDAEIHKARQRLVKSINKELG